MQRPDVRSKSEGIALSADVSSNGFDPAMEAAIADHFAQKYGVPCQIVGADRRSNLGSCAKDSQFWTVRVRSGTKQQSVHVKLNLTPKRPRGLNKSLNGHGLAVPAFFGRVICNEREALLWEHVPGVVFQTMEELCDSQIVAVAAALANIAKATDRVTQGLALPHGMTWVQPVAKDILQFSKNSYIKAVKEELKIFTELEDRTLDVLSRFPSIVLTHNDVKGPNIIFGERLAIVDWDSASIGPHGASLRCFTRYGDRVEELAAAAYVEESARLGMLLNIADVLFVMRAQEIFWGIVSGVRRRRPHRIVAGLTAFCRIAPVIRSGAMLDRQTWHALAAE